MSRKPVALVALLLALVTPVAIGDACATVPNPTAARDIVVDASDSAQSPYAHVSYGGPIVAGEDYDLTVKNLPAPVSSAYAVFDPTGHQVGNPRQPYSTSESTNVTFPSIAIGTPGVWSVRGADLTVEFGVVGCCDPPISPCPAPRLRIEVSHGYGEPMEGTRTVGLSITNDRDASAHNVVSYVAIFADLQGQRTWRFYPVETLGNLAPGQTLDTTLAWDTEGVLGDVIVEVVVGSDEDLVVDHHADFVLVHGVGGMIFW